jgi:putative metallohydrolase (TIGR04338 family)
MPATDRPRDSQRARLYRAESEVDVGRRLPTVDVLQAYVDGLLGAGWFRARWGARALEVRPGYGHRRATADENGVLQMPRWARSELVLLHEVAHCVTPPAFAAHGREYAGVLLSLARHALGPAPAQALEDAFGRHRVAWCMAAVPVRCGTA